MDIDKYNKVISKKSNKKKPKITILAAAIFLSTVLLYASFVAYPNQSAYGHDSSTHSLCFDQTLNAFDCRCLLIIDASFHNALDNGQSLRHTLNTATGDADILNR